MARQRINPETGRVEVLHEGLFGDSWVDADEGHPVRVNRETGEIEEEHYGLFNSSWTSNEEHARLNVVTGEVEHLSDSGGWIPLDQDNDDLEEQEDDEGNEDSDDDDEDSEDEFDDD
jgi:hypothetical protein